MSLLFVKDISIYDKQLSQHSHHQQQTQQVRCYEIRQCVRLFFS